MDVPQAFPDDQEDVEQQGTGQHSAKAVLGAAVKDPGPALDLIGDAVSPVVEVFQSLTGPAASGVDTRVQKLHVQGPVVEQLAAVAKKSHLAILGAASAPAVQEGLLFLGAPGEQMHNIT